MIVWFIFFLLMVYQLKHFAADYLLQGEYMLGKFKDHGWLRPLLAHAGVHATFTYAIAAGVFLLAGFPNPLAPALMIGLFDGTIHFVMDRLKAGSKYMGRWKAITSPEYVAYKKTLAAKVGDKYFEPTFDQWCTYEEEMLGQDQADARKALRGNRLFWIALGFDQMVHHLTHYVCIFLILALVLVSL
jgi:hypothetical protein